MIANEYMGFLGGVVAQPCEYPESHSTGHLRRVNCLVYEVYPAVWGGGQRLEGTGPQSRQASSSGGRLEASRRGCLGMRPRCRGAEPSKELSLTARACGVESVLSTQTPTQIFP